MDHITNDTSLIGPCDVIPVGAQNPRFPVVGHRLGLASCPNLERANSASQALYPSLMAYCTKVCIL